MTLSTVGEDGVPDARLLILKGVDARGFAFASTASSRKGRQLAAHPEAALTFWWQPLLRSVRLNGRVVEASAEETAADLAARSADARATVEEGGLASVAAGPRQGRVLAGLNRPAAPAGD